VGWAVSTRTGRAEASSAWRADPSKFLGRPKLPGYKDKQKGRNLLVYTTQALSIPALRQGVIAPSMLGITIATQQHNVQQVRIVPRLDFYIVEVIYEHVPVQATGSGSHAGCDIGVDNLATLASDKPGFIPRIVNGRPVKSSNQYYNKHRAESRAARGARHQSPPERLTTRRTRRIDHHSHTASRRIVDLLVAEGTDAVTGRTRSNRRSAWGGGPSAVRVHPARASSRC
jgi:putative transposase